MLAQSMTETEIAQQLGVDQPTISRDIKILKELSQQFIYDLAKSDPAFYHKQCIDGIEAVLKKGWKCSTIIITNIVTWHQETIFCFESNKRMQ
jgi:IS30 family transposase